MIDAWPFLVAASAGVFAAAIVYFADRIWTPTNTSTRLWSVVFPAALFASIGYLVAAVSGGPVWAVGSANAALVLAWGAGWAGCRAFHGRRSAFLVTIVLAVAAGFASLVPSPFGPLWAGSPFRMTLLVIISGLGLAEVLRGRLRSLRGGRVIAIVFGIHGVYTLVRLVVVVLAQAGAIGLPTIFASTTVSLLELGAAIGGVIAIVMIRLEDRARSESGARAARTVSRRAFSARMRSTTRAPLVIVSIEMYDQLRAAYGAAQARLLHTELYEAARLTAPESAFVTALPLGRAAVLLPGLNTARASTYLDRVESDFAERRKADELDVGVRVRGVVAAEADANAIYRLTLELDAADRGDVVVPRRPTHPVLDGLEDTVEPR